MPSPTSIPPLFCSLWTDHPFQASYGEVSVPKSRSYGLLSFPESVRLILAGSVRRPAKRRLLVLLKPWNEPERGRVLVIRKPQREDQRESPTAFFRAFERRSRQKQGPLDSPSLCAASMGSSLATKQQVSTSPLCFTSRSSRCLLMSVRPEKWLACEERCRDGLSSRRCHTTGQGENRPRYHPVMDISMGSTTSCVQHDVCSHWSPCSCLL